MIAIIIVAVFVGFLIVKDEVGEVVDTVSGKLVLHRERAEGVHPRLLELLDEWEHEGPFQIRVGVDGGLRVDEGLQRKLFASGVTKARTLSETPHGHGGALDLHPMSFPDGTAREELTQQMIDDFSAIGDFVEARGFTWGGRWKTTFPPYGDMPHVEMKNWFSLPMPKGNT